MFDRMKQMFSWPKVRGVTPQLIVDESGRVTGSQQIGSLKNFVKATEIHGDDKSDFEPWRIGADGSQWMRRRSIVADEVATITGIDLSPIGRPDEDTPDDEPTDTDKVYDPKQILLAARARLAAEELEIRGGQR